MSSCTQLFPFRWEVFEFKVLNRCITQILSLLHPNHLQKFFVVQLDSPIKHGQTRYRSDILLIEKNVHVEIRTSD